MASQTEFAAKARGDLLIVTEPISEFYAIYVRRADAPQLSLMRRAPSSDHALIAAAFQVAISKARELGWIA
jgi:hypothetical protein